jgi:hypothetical protein
MTTIAWNGEESRRCVSKDVSNALHDVPLSTCMACPFYEAFTEQNKTGQSGECTFRKKNDKSRCLCLNPR